MTDRARFSFWNSQITPDFQTIQPPQEAHFTLFPHVRLGGNETKDDDLFSLDPVTEWSEKKEKEEEKLRKKTEQIISRAEEEAEKIRTKAHQQGLEKGLEKGFEEGFQKGLTKGEEEGRQEIKKLFSPLKERLEDLINQTEQIRIDILKKQEDEILQLCLDIAQQIIHIEVKQNPQVILANLREGLKSIGSHKILAITLNPLDLDLIQKLKDDDAAAFLNLTGVDLIADPHLKQGGCFIQTDLGYIDASLENQYQELKKNFGK